MTSHIGAAGRRARDLALGRIDFRPSERRPAPARFPVRPGPLPLLQRAASSPPTEGDEEGVPPSAPAETAAAAIERGTPPPSPEEVADRVYRLFCQDFRRDRERWGHWW